MHACNYVIKFTHSVGLKHDSLHMKVFSSYLQVYCLILMAAPNYHHYRIMNFEIIQTFY